jgi:hypothetical protein
MCLSYLTMTLVMSLLSKDYAIQVSDRRFVWFSPDGQIDRVDDEENKSVVWTPLNAFAFTGIGNLGVSGRTDLWLAREISKWEEETPVEKQSQPGLMEAIATRATAYFNGPRISRIDKELRRHAFVGVGWGRESPETDLVPHMVRIGNFRATEPADDRFTINFVRLDEPAAIRVWWDGQLLTPEEESDLNKLNALDSSSVDFANGASFVLGEIVRRVASRNDAVGRGLLITVMPRKSIREGESDWRLMAAPASADEQTFLYVAPDDRQGIVYGPTIVSGGGVFSNFMAGSLDAPEMAELKKAVEESQGKSSSESKEVPPEP